MTEREEQIHYYVQCFCQRRYTRGNGPTKAEIQHWCKQNVGHMDRAERREIERQITAQMKHLYGGSNEGF